MSKAGVKQIVVCDAGSLATSPTNPLAVGLRKSTVLEMTPFENIDDHLGRKLRNKINFKMEAESLQPTLDSLEKAIGWLNQNCDMQILTNPQSAGANSEDVFQFAGDEAMGIGLEFIFNNSGRSLKWMFERALDYDAAQTKIDGADSESAVTFGGITGSGADYTLQRPPKFAAFESPKATALASVNDIVERELKISTEGRKSIYNADIIDYLMFTLTLKIRNASVSKAVTEFSKVQSPSIYWKETNGASTYDAIDIAAGVLSKTDEFMIGDDEREISMTFEGKVPLYDCSFEYGDGKGGETDDTDAIKGGTFKVVA